MASPAKPGVEKRSSQQQPKSGATNKQPPDVMPGDQVYAKHPQRGPIALKVTAVGADGFRGECDKHSKHGVPFADYLGHKARAVHRFEVLDEGADGTIVQDATGHTRFLAGPLPQPEAPGASDKLARSNPDDPLIDGLGQLAKAFEANDMQIPDGARLFLKAGVPIKNRAGRALKEVTDKGGHQTHRWQSTAQPAPEAGNSGGTAPMKHGDTVGFQHGKVQGEGKIVASGADGVTLEGDGGREHKVRHEHLLDNGPGREAGRGGERIGRNMNAPPPPKEWDTSTNFRPDFPVVNKKLAGQPGAAAGNAQGGAAAPAGETGAKPAAGEGPKPFFDEKETSSLPKKAQQPVKDPEELFKQSVAALDHLQTWLNRGKGIASQAGAETMTKGPGDVTPEEWDKPGAMLFIAKLKGRERAAEKVASDYEGDWSKLTDTVRGSIAVDSIADLHGMVERLRKGGMKLAQQPKDRFAKPTPVGYRDMLLNITLPNGLVGELQLHVKSMLKAKNEGHEHYETERTLDGKEKRGEGLSDAEKATMKTAQDKQKAIYNGAWEGANRVSGASGGEMAKAMGGEGEFSFFEHDGAHFRRKNGGITRSVDDVLHEGKWKPYKGKDPLKPALFGDEVADPTAGGQDGDASDGGAGGQMAKADGMRLLLPFSGMTLAKAHHAARPMVADAGARLLPPEVAAGGMMKALRLFLAPFRRAP